MTYSNDRSQSEFWLAACSRARSILATRFPALSGWNIQFAAFGSKSERLALEAKLEQFDSFVDSVSGYFDHEQRAIVVFVDEAMFGNETMVREFVEDASGCEEDDPEVAAARWIVESVGAEMNRKRG